MKKKREFFVSVKICRNDIISYYEDDKDFKEKKKQINALTDKQMEWIANAYCEACCETDYYSTLAGLFEHIKKRGN